jgi:hypothetical protein
MSNVPMASHPTSGWIVWAVAAALAGGACFGPAYPQNIPCSERGTCPSGQVCDVVENLCRATLEGLDRDMDGATAEIDCDDLDGRVFPGNDEVAYNDLDDDCDPETPDDDIDRDGHPVAADCDDADASVFPGAVEVCNRRDDNCNDAVDESVGGLWYTDSDGDGFGDPDTAVRSCSGTERTVADGTDCDDKSSAIYPGAIEVCDGADNNCNTLADDDDPTITGQSVWFGDGDGDGHGSPSATRLSCVQPPGYVEDMLDCDDGNSAVFPGAPDQCDAVDDDCSGSTLPCASAVTFDDPSDLDLLVREGSIACGADVIPGQGLQLACPDNADVVFWLDFAIQDAQSIRIFTRVYTDNWVDVGTGFGPWGPNPGYSFYLSDPLDSAQGALCTNGDTCPSITKSNQSILALQNVRTSPGQSYTLDVTLDGAGETFGLSFAESSYTLAASDLVVRSGRVGLHCAEANCTFESLSISIE